MTRSSRPSPVVAFFGWLLMCSGALVAVTTGACTVFMVVAPVLQGGGVEYFGGLLSWLVLVMIVGGVPCLIGMGMFFLGRLIARRGNARQLPPRKVEETDDQA